LSHIEASIAWRALVGGRDGGQAPQPEGARQRAGLTPDSASNTLSCEGETLLDSDHGIYRDVRQEAGKELEVKVRHGEGLANHPNPE
jgi:hypothetical protein